MVIILCVVGLGEITLDTLSTGMDKKYETHLIPSGIFYDIPSVIGPDCVVNQESFLREVTYLKNGFNTNLIFISPKAHVVTESHITEDKQKLVDTQVALQRHCPMLQGQIC